MVQNKVDYDQGYLNYAIELRPKHDFVDSHCKLPRRSRSRSSAENLGWYVFPDSHRHRPPSGANEARPEESLETQRERIRWDGGETERDREREKALENYIVKESPPGEVPHPHLEDVVPMNEKESEPDIPATLFRGWALK